MNIFLDKLQRFINLIFKLEIRKFPNQFQRSQRTYLSNNKINKIFDVGANQGQFAQGIFDLGYTGKIISFEPINATFKQLVNNSRKNPNWNPKNFALGDFDGFSEINVSPLSASSSILPFVQDMVDVVPDLNYVRKEKIEIKKLDSIFDEYVESNDRVFLKIDTQGFEKTILDGAIQSLEKLTMIQLEMSLVEIYQGEYTMQQMISFLRNYGFELWALEPGFYHPKTRKLLQVDAIFMRN